MRGERVRKSGVEPPVDLDSREEQHEQSEDSERDRPVAVAVQNMQPETVTVESDQPVWLTWTQDSVVLLPPD